MGVIAWPRAEPQLSFEAPVVVLLHRHQAVAKVLHNQLAAWGHQVVDTLEVCDPATLRLGLVEASNGDAVREVARRFPTVPLVAVASLRRPFDVFDAVRGGAWTCVVVQDIHAIRSAVGVRPPKPGEVDPLRRTIERVLESQGGEAGPTEGADDAAAHLVAIRALTKGVGDRLNNPLTIVKMAIETLGDALTDIVQGAPLGERLTELQEVVRGCPPALERMLTVSQAMRNFAMPSSSALGNVEVIRIVRELAPESDLTAPPEARVFANEKAVREALGALLDNALQSYDANVTARPVAVTITVERPRVTITITDRGRGMSDDVLARAFEPFFSHGKGPSALGMGLTVARDRVMAMRGELNLQSELGSGTVAIVGLPSAV